MATLLSTLAAKVLNHGLLESGHVHRGPGALSFNVPSMHTTYVITGFRRRVAIRIWYILVII